MDETEYSVAVTLWGKAASIKGLSLDNIIAFKNCRVSDYQGCSLNASFDEKDIKINVNHPRTTLLKKWS